MSGSPGATRNSVASIPLVLEFRCFGQYIAWRLYTKGITSSEAERHARIDGDHHLAKAALRMVSVIG